MRHFFLYLFSFYLTVSLFAQKPDNLVIPPFQQVPERKPQFPLKTDRMIYSDSLVSLANENIQQDSRIRAIRDSILQAADKWLSFTDDELVVLMPDARVPRDFDLSPKGCPVHGDSVFKLGRSPWIIDLSHPFQVRCPIDGQLFPSNDFASYYASDFKDKKDWNTDYTDDGWGWLSPEGERFWFVAYSNQVIWGNIVPGLLSLARAYFLSGDTRYASKAAFMLYRMASVYPSMNHEDQSRYGLYSKSRGSRWPGKIMNHISETYIIECAAEAYDLVWETIDTNLSLQKRTGKSGEEIRAFIEANLLEDAMEAFEDGKILGNFGMHQSAMITVHLSRQHAGMEKAIHSMFYEPVPHSLKDGIRYAMYNQIFRDGIPSESPDYNVGWVNTLLKVEGKLPAGYKELLTTFRFKQMFDAPLDMIAIGKYTPDIGDSGSVFGGISVPSSTSYYQAYSLYHEPRYLPWIKMLKPNSSDDSFRSIFRQPLPDFPALEDGRAIDIQPSRLMAGYGLGILNNKADKTAVAFTYGKHYWHVHWDYLNIEVFANGQKMMPDLGYPEGANDFISGRYTWSWNTVSHNTVVVDQKRQERAFPGVLHDFANGSFARTMDASSRVYENTSEYRRNMIMVDTEDGQSYLVDFFDVCGGTRHDYLLHGPPGSTYCNDDEWSDVFEGSFAGTTVEPGYLYDDESLQQRGIEVGYINYKGSGFQHLFHVRQLKNGKGILEYRHINDEDARLRIFPLSTGEQDIYMADAYDKPRAKSHILKYMICSRKTDGNIPLASTFVSVLEPYQGEKHILAETRLTKLDMGNGHVVVVERDHHTDIIIYDPSGSTKKLNRYNLQTDAVSTVATFNKSGALTRAFFSCGSYLHCQREKFSAETVRGKVISFDALERTFQVEMEENGRVPEKGISGQIAHFTNDFRTTVHPLSSVNVSGKLLNIKVKDDFLIGYFRVREINGNRLTPDDNYMPFTEHYHGATILDKNYRPSVVVADVNNGFRLMEPVELPLKMGDEAWICNIGIGDQFVIKPVFSWERVLPE